MIDHGSVKKEGNAYRTKLTEYDAFHGNWKFHYDIVWLWESKLVVHKSDDTPFIIDNFLDSGYKVRVTRTGKDQYTYEYWDTTTLKYVDLDVVTGAKDLLGITVSDSKTGGIYDKLHNVFWNPTFSRETLMVASADGEGSSIKIYARSDDKKFHITEPVYHTSRVKFSWPEKAYALLKRGMTFDYFRLDEISASISNESYTTENYYIVTEKNGGAEHNIFPVKAEDGTIKYYDVWYEKDSQGHIIGDEHWDEVEVRTEDNTISTATNVWKLVTTVGGTAADVRIDGKIVAFMPGDGFNTDGSHYYGCVFVDSEGSVIGSSEEYFVKIVRTNGAITSVSLVTHRAREATDVAGTESNIYTLIFEKANGPLTDTIYDTSFYKREAGTLKLSDSLTLSGYYYNNEDQFESYFNPAGYTGNDASYNSMWFKYSSASDTYVQLINYVSISATQRVLVDVNNPVFTLTMKTTSGDITATGTICPGKLTVADGKGGTETLDGSYFTTESARYFLVSTPDSVTDETENYTVKIYLIGENGPELLVLADQDFTFEQAKNDNDEPLYRKERLTVKDDSGNVTRYYYLYPNGTSWIVGTLAMSNHTGAATELRYANNQLILDEAYFDVAGHTGYSTEEIVVETYLGTYMMVIFERNADGSVKRSGTLDLSNQRSRVAARSDSGAQKLVLRFGSKTNKPIMSLFGPIDGVALNKVTLPLAQDEYTGMRGKLGIGDDDLVAYQITEDLYITTSGLIIYIKTDVSGTITFASRYDGTEYISTNIKAGDFTAGENHPKVTFLPGQEIRLELRTDHIATDMLGNYYYRAADGDDWQKITAEIGTVNMHNGLGTITIGKGNAEKVYLNAYYGVNEEGQETLYYEMPGSGDATVRAGSDGTVIIMSEKPEDDLTQMLVKDEKGTDFNVSLIKAADDVVIRLADDLGSILDGDSGKDDTDIEVGGTVTIISGSTGTIGTDEDPLDANADILIMTDDETVPDVNHIDTETHLYFEDGVKIDKNVIVDGVTWDIATREGSVVFADTIDAAEAKYTLSVINGGTASISTNKLLDKQVDENGDPVYIYTDNPDAQKEGNVLIKNVTVVDGSTLNVAAGTNSTICEIRAIDSTVSISAKEDNVFDNAILKRSALTLAAENGRLGMRMDQQPDGSTAGGTVLYDQEIDANNGRKAVILLDKDDTDSTASISLSGAQIGSAGNRLQVDIPEAVTLHIPAVGDLYLDSQVLVPQKTNAADGSFYDVEITAADLGFGLARVVLPTNPKANEYIAPDVNTEGSGIGDEVKGDYLEHITDETHSGALPEDLQNNEGIARRIVGKIREKLEADPAYDWTELFDEDQILAVLADPEARKELLALVSEEEIMEILSDLRGNDTVSDEDRDLAAWILENGDADSWKTVLEELLAQRTGDIESALAALADAQASGDTDAEAAAEAALAAAVDSLTDAEISAIVDGYVPAEGDPAGETDRELAARLIRSGDDWKTALEQLLAQKIENIVSGYAALAEAQESGDTDAVAAAETALAAAIGGLTDDEILALVTGYAPADEAAAEAWREARLEEIISVTGSASEPVGAEAIWSALKDTEDDEELVQLITALLNAQTAEGSTYAIVPDLGGLIETLLTDDERQALIDLAISEAAIPEEADPPYDDDDSRALNVVIGTSTGVTDLFNDGTVNITVTGGTDENGNAVSSDFTAEDIRSERGDVNITVENGSILAAGDGDQQIIGKNVSLKASEDIGSDTDELDLQQKDTTPVVTVVPTEGEREDGSRTGTVHLDENGNWVMDTVLSYDWVRKDLNDESMRLDAEAENGSIVLEEIEGGTGAGIISAGEDVTITTDGDLTDLRTEQEKADGRNNIEAGSDVTVNVPDGKVGTEDDPVKVSVGSEMSVIDKGDVNLITDDDLTVTIDSEEGVIRVDGGKDVTVDVTGDIIPGGHVTAGGDANVAAEGNITDAAVTAGGDANVAAEGNITDAAVTAGGDANVAAEGNITDAAVTAGDDANVAAEGDITDTAVTAGGDANVAAEGDITDTAVTAGGDAEVTAQGGITGALITAGDDANVTANGDISDSTVKGDNVSLTADADADGNGAIGTGENPVLVDTASGNTGSGSLSASGTEVYVEELTGDLAVDQITSTQGDTVISSPGDVTDANAGSAVADAAAAQDAASDARDKADAAQDVADILDANASALEAEAEQARQEADDAQDAADDADAEASIKESEADDAERVAQEAEEAAALALENGDEDAAEKQLAAETERAKADEARREAEAARAEADRLQGIADDKDDIADDLETAAEAARNDADAAQRAADDAQAAADHAQQAAEAAVEAANNADQAIETAGDLTIHAGGSVGSDGAPLDTDIGGSLTVGAAGNVNIANQGDLNISDLDADGNAAADRDVILTAGGDLNSDKVITGGSATINTLDGNAGSAGKPLALSVDALSGNIAGDGQNTGNGVITNNKSLEIGDLSADGSLNISVKGNVTAGDNPNGEANVSADKAKITATGNVGTKDKPLVTAADDLSMSGKDIDIHSETDVTVDSISGKDVNITSDGRTETGSGKTNVAADNLNIDSFGGIGTEAKPLIVNVSGKVDVATQYEEAYITNIYKKPEPPKPEPPKPEPPKPEPEKKVSGTLMTKMTAKGKKSLVVSWSKISGADGYDIFFAVCGGKKGYKLIKTVKNGKLSFTITGLAKGTAYKAYVKAWIMKGGKKVYVRTSPDVHAFTGGGNKKYTNAKSVSVKKTRVKLKKGKTYKIKASVKKLKKGKKLMSHKHTAKLRYMSTNKKVAIVTKSGKIKAVGKGTCYVYVYAHNGARKKIKVTVK